MSEKCIHCLVSCVYLIEVRDPKPRIVAATLDGEAALRWVDGYTRLVGEAGRALIHPISAAIRTAS